MTTIATLMTDTVAMAARAAVAFDLTARASFRPRRATESPLSPAGRKPPALCRAV
jgi:hypothetical protein